MKKIITKGLFQKKKKRVEGLILKGIFSIDFVVCEGNHKTYKLVICFVIYLYSFSLSPSERFLLNFEYRACALYK